MDYAPNVSIAKTLIGVANTNHDTWTGDAGDVVSYQVVVTNTGDTTLTGLSVTDLLSGAVLSGTQSSALAVGGTETLTASYTLTQADIDGNKSIVNTAQVTDDQQITQTSTAAAVPVDYAPNVSIAKTLIGVANTNNDTWTGDAGDVVSYQVVVTNTGDTTLTGLSVTDLLSGAVLSGTQSSTLAVGGTETLTASYTLTQADVDGNKSIVNTAHVTDNHHITQSSTASAVLVDYAPNVSIAKTLIGVANTNNDTWTGDAGDVVSYQVVVTNTGDTTLTGLSVTDLLSGAVLSGTQSSTLAVGGTETLTASYTLTQADVDGNKSIVNTAQVTDNQQITQTSTAAAVPVDQHPGVSIQKQISIDGGAWQSAGTPSAYAGVSNVSFRVIVTNTGDLTDHVSASDVTASSGGFNGSFTFGAGSNTSIVLAPGASATSNVVTVTASSLVGTQTDTATVNGTSGSLGSPLLASANAAYTSSAAYVGTFAEKTAGLSIGYWAYNHQAGLKSSGGWGRWTEAPAASFCTMAPAHCSSRILPQASSSTPARALTTLGKSCSRRNLVPS